MTGLNAALLAHAVNARAVSAGESSTLALKGSTEEAQFHG